MQAVATAAVGHPRERSEPAARADYDSAFTALFGTYYTRVFAFVYSRVRDVDLAKDLVSEVFERAYAKGHDVRDQAAYSSWLFVIARNAVVGHYRQRQRELVKPGEGRGWSAAGGSTTAAGRLCASGRANRPPDGGGEDAAAAGPGVNRTEVRRRTEPCGDREDHGDDAA